MRALIDVPFRDAAASDLAWALDRGRPDVVIAVLDSGIEWRNPQAMADLADQAYLNRAELPPPAGAVDAVGALGAAGGADAAGADPYDRNGDGRFSVSDYDADPRVTDRNDNEMLDPEDLILTPEFNDGVDSDGNAFWYVARDRLGRIAEVWPLPPHQTDVFRDPPKRGQTTINPKRFRYGGTEYSADEIVHFTGFSLPGRLRGLSPIEQHMHTLGLSIAAEEYGESWFGNGATPSGIVELPADAGVPDPEVLAEMQDGIARDHSGLANAHRPGILYGGAKWVPLTISNEASQFLETRNYQLRDIARIFRQPPHKIGDLERATFSNIEEQNIDHVTSTLRAWFVRWEQQLGKDVLMDPSLYCEHNMDASLRGKTLERAQANTLKINAGAMVPNEWRAQDNQNPLPWGDERVNTPNNTATGASASAPTGGAA